MLLRFVFIVFWAMYSAMWVMQFLKYTHIDHHIYNACISMIT